MLHRFLALLIVASLALSVPALGAPAPVTDSCVASMTDDSGCCGGGGAVVCNDGACLTSCGAGAAGVSGPSNVSDLARDAVTAFRAAPDSRAGLPPDPFPPKR